MVDKLTDEEHEARAMLLGMRYHHGNGEPFYYEVDETGVPRVETFVNAYTFEPITPLFDGLNKRRAIKSDQGNRWRWIP